MKLLRPTQEQMDDISMPESFRNFVIEQQGIQGNQDAIQRAALQEQNALVAEQAAQEYFNQPATARERFLADNPQAYASSAGPGIYREQMMQTRQSSLADRTLAPTIAKSLPIEVRGEFVRRVEAGEPVIQARDAVEIMAHNQKQRAKLAEFYSRDELNSKFGSDAAPISDVDVNFAIRERKAGEGSTLGARKAYVEFATERLKRFAPEGFAPDPTDEVNYPLYEAALKDLEEAEISYQEALRGAGGIRRLEAFQPDLAPPGGAVPKGAEIQGLGAAPAAQAQPPEELDIETRLTRVPVTEQAAELERLRKEQEGKIGKEKQWEQAKTTLEEKLKEVFPDKPYEGTSIKPLEQLALQIIGGVQVADDDPNAPTDEFGVTPKIPIHEAALRRLKLGRFGKAFTEEGRDRLNLFGLVGTQDVTNNELIRDWAQKFAEKRGLINTPVSERSDLAPEERELGSKLLDKYVPATIQ
jgi:hypothetical protein